MKNSDIFYTSFERLLDKFLTVTDRLNSNKALGKFVVFIESFIWPGTRKCWRYRVRFILPFILLITGVLAYLLGVSWKYIYLTYVVISWGIALFVIWRVGANQEGF